MKMLITGGTTFVSRFAAEYFVSKGNDVTVINRGSRPQVGGVTLLQCDRTQLGDTLRGKRFDVILDITAYTKEHVQTLIESGVEFGDYIFISSSAVYPETNPRPFTEEQACGRNAVWGDYGIHKLEAERVLTEHAPGAYILRPPYLYGLYDNVYREAFVFDCAMQGRSFFLPGDGGMRLQFFHVRDLCRFMEILLARHPAQRIFNVGNPDAVAVKDWVEFCYWAAGASPRFIGVDKAIPQRNYFPFHDYDYMLDVSRQTELMPETIPLVVGLKEAFDWYKDHPDSIYSRKPYMEYIDKTFAD